jgi:hypothetical protein
VAAFWPFRLPVWTLIGAGELCLNLKSSREDQVSVKRFTRNDAMTLSGRVVLRRGHPPDTFFSLVKNLGDLMA